LNPLTLRQLGFDIESKNHALAILDADFPQPLRELCKILTNFRMADAELMCGGGGEAEFTQRLRKALSSSKWKKRNIIISKVIDGQEKSSTTHEIDHVRKSGKGTIALEIEWNNKDPFYDRDLENFHRLHVEGAISVGIIITRGKSLQENLQQILAQCASNHGIRSLKDFDIFGLHPTPRQRRMIEKSTGKFVSRWAKVFVNDKFGTATTHWNKLLERIDRGVGNPCPLLLIGIPASSIYQRIPEYGGVS